MTPLSPDQVASRKRTLGTSLLLSAPGPLVTGFAVLSSQSSTQLADFIRRGVELIAIFLSWWIFRRIHRTHEFSETDRKKLERIAGLSVAGAMVCSGVVMLVVALSRLSAFETGGNVIFGLVIAILGLLTNSWFWRRYAHQTSENYNAVIASQRDLYRAKTSVDLCVAAALAAVAIAPYHPLTRYLDISGSVIVAGYLLWTGGKSAHTQLGGFGVLLNLLNR